MQYYKNHLIINDDFVDNSKNFINIDSLSEINENMIYYGQLDYDKELENYTCNNLIVKNNRGIYKDIVYIQKSNIEDNNELEVINIKTRNIKPIVGILYLDSKIKYGSIKEKQLYLFKPTNKKYPHFYVPYKPHNNQKLYVTINFNYWNIDNKFPIGTLVEIIGPIGDINSEYEHLRYFYNIKNNIWKIDNNKFKNDTVLLESIQNEIADFEVFSIDPLNSKDIDDAFHFKYIESEKKYEVGIHIANPFVFFKDEINIIMDRVSTVYQPHRKYNLLPNLYSDNFISLIENNNRYALSLILLFDSSNNLLEYTIKECIVFNKKNYDYDLFDITYKNHSNLKDFVDFSSNFFREKNLDSHKLVEKWMIYTNKKIAIEIINNNIISKYLIIRKHTAFSKIGEEENKNVCENEELNNFLNIRKENSAIYEFYNKYPDILTDQTHSKIDKCYYTHFTSPIRRSIDLYIHALIIDPNKIKELKINLDLINNFTKNCRKMDRQCSRLKFLFELKELENNLETTAYIIEIKKNKLSVFIPEFKLEEKIIIIPKKMEKIIEINNLTDSEINFKKENINYCYRLYDKINIKLYPLLSMENIFDKLKIEII